MKRVLTLIGSFVLLFAWQQSEATRWYVSIVATGSNNGTSWQNAFNKPQDALDAAISGDTIWVAAGTYNPTKQLVSGFASLRDVGFLLKEGVHIYGGFAGNEVNLTDRLTDSANLHVANSTVFSGTNSSSIGSGNYHVFVAVNLSSFTIDGATITGAIANTTNNATIAGASIARNAGGGLYNYASQGVLRNVVFKNNFAQSTSSSTGGGAALYNIDVNKAGTGTLLIENCVFFSNSTKNCNGGSMINQNSSVVIKNSYFTSNKCETDDEGGGAIDNREGSNCIIENVVFDQNESTNSGGAVYNDESSPKLTNVLFLKNKATGSCGGGMDTDGGSDAILENVTFIGNFAEEDGGGLYGWKSSPILNNVYFYDNEANGNGGGMYYYNTCRPQVSNSVFKGNRANENFGGFGLERESEAILTNVLFTRNFAIKEGGGIGTINTDATKTTIIGTNLTIVNNSVRDGKGGGGFDMGKTTQLRNTLIVGNKPEDVAIDMELVFNTRNSIIDDIYVENGLTNPYGTAFTASISFTDSTNDDYTIETGSPAIDKGDSSFFSASSTPDLSFIKEDLDGNSRIIGNNIDIGAYEKQPRIDTASATISINTGILVAPGTNVTFTLTPVNAGDDATFQWYKNSTIIAGETSLVYTAKAGTDFLDGDTIWAQINTYSPYIYPASFASDYIVIEVCKQVVAPQATIIISTGNLVPSGTMVDFIVNAKDAGIGVTYEWYKNGSVIQSAMSSKYTARAGVNFNDGDSIWVKITSNEPCIVPNFAISNKVVMNICSNVLTPSIDVVADKSGLLLKGTTVQFEANVKDAGTNPDIRWFKNGKIIDGEVASIFIAIVGTNIDNNDTIWADITSHDPCVVPDNSISNKTIIRVCPSAIEPSATIFIDKGNLVPPGTNVLFSANVTDAGTNPDYEWYVNGNVSPSQNTAFFDAVAGVDFKDGDSVWVKVISHDPCAFPNFGISNKIIINVCSSVLVPSATITTEPKGLVPVGASVTFNLEVKDAGSNPNIVWYKNNTTISGQNAALSYTAIAGTDFNEGDEIWVKVTSFEVCAVPDNAESNRVTVDFCSQILIPNITISKDVNTGIFADIEVNFELTISDEGENPEIQWYKNEDIIPSVNGLSYKAVSGIDFNNGDEIWAKLISNDPCAVPNNVSSERLQMTVFGLNVEEIASNFDVKLLPNPNKGSFVLDANFVIGEPYQIKIVDMLGRNIYLDNFQANSTSKEISIEKSVAPGLYILTVFNKEQGIKSIRFVIE